MTERSGACSTRSRSSCRSITPPQVNRDTLWRRPVTGGPALTFWHIYTVGSKGAASPLSHLAECLAALMDEAHPLRPAEFYLRLTSRCCHRCFHAAPPSSISLLHSAGLSASPLSALTLSLSLPFYFFSLSTCPHMTPTANISLYRRRRLLLFASRHPSSSWHGRFPSSE